MVGKALLLTASLWAGQTYHGQTINTPQSAGNCTCQSGPSGPVHALPGSQPPLLNRGSIFGPNRPILRKIGSLFGKKDQANPVPMADFPRRMPNSLGVEGPLLRPLEAPFVNQPGGLKPISHQTIVASKKPTPILPKFAAKIGHEDDFSWVTGQLQHENGTWVIYYATPETVDRYEGKLLLHPAGDMANLQSGDLVSAHGNVVHLPSGRQAAYRATRVDLIERGR